MVKPSVPKWEDKLGYLPPEVREVLINVLQEYAETFTEPDREGCTLKVIHRIPTRDSKPVLKWPYRVPFHLRPVVKEHIGSMLGKEIISSSNSPWSAPVVLVQKKSASGKIKYMFCTDFRGLNAVTKVGT